MPKPIKPEKAFHDALAAAYPGMSPEMRRGIVGIAVRSFITPVEIDRAPIKYRTGMSEAEARADDRESNHLLRDII